MNGIPGPFFFCTWAIGTLAQGWSYMCTGVKYLYQGQMFVPGPGSNICTRVKYLSQGHNYVPGPVTRSCDEVSGVQKNISGTIYATVFGLF